MNRRMKRKMMRKESAGGPPLPEKKSRKRGRKGLNMKIAADGSIHLKHMSELGCGVAFMPPVEIQVAGLED